MSLNIKNPIFRVFDSNENLLLVSKSNFTFLVRSNSAKEYSKKRLNEHIFNFNIFKYFKTRQRKQMKTTLLFGIHCHQPIDNFNEVVFEAIEKSYKPFLQVLKNYPSFKIAVHYSGWLLEFIQKNDQNLFTLMQEMGGQIEFFSGGYYEPILASIPQSDRIGQIKKLNNFIKKHFNQTPKGLWLTERVWDNSIIDSIKKCGIEYVIVDDYHFIASGYDENNLNGYFITEEGGESIALFPIKKSLRYSIPFSDNKSVNKLLKSSKTDKERAAIIFDDGEKFGIWPKTYKSVYENEWLKEFIETTLKDKDINVSHFSDYFQQQKPISLAYLPSVSYFEMGEWSLRAKDTILLERLKHSINEGNEFLKGGIWKNFLTKYQESNWINKRTIELSKKQLEIKEYKEALYKAQCNDALWHGVFGGLYLPNLRDNAYRYIIECEKILFKEEGIEEIDIDFDFYKEYKLNSQNLLAIISPKNGACIMELDLKQQGFNLQNTLSRYEEAYHSKIQKHSNEKKNELTTIHNAILKTSEDVKLYYDWYLKKSLIDHISKDVDLKSFESCSFISLGDFANNPFDLIESKKNKIKFQKEGKIRDDKATITKSIKLKNDKLEFKISLKSQNEENLTYINEWNLHFANLKDIIINNQILLKPFVIYSDKLEIEDKYLQKKFLFQFKSKIDIFIYPLKTVSQSERGVDYTTQGVTIGFKFDLQKELNIEFEFKA